MSPNLWNGFAGTLMGILSIGILIPLFLYRIRSHRNLRSITIGLGLLYFFLSLIVPVHPDLKYTIAQPGEMVLKVALLCGAFLLFTSLRSTETTNVADPKEEQTDGS